MAFPDVLAVMAGGFCGAIARYLASGALNAGRRIPYGTWTVNLLGSLLIGFFFGSGWHGTMVSFAAVGFAGGLTTFSTMTKEAVELWGNGDKKRALLYLASTYVTGVVLAAAGYALGGMI